MSVKLAMMAAVTRLCNTPAVIVETVRKAFIWFMQQSVGGALHGRRWGVERVSEAGVSRELCAREQAGDGVWLRAVR